MTEIIPDPFGPIRKMAFPKGLPHHLGVHMRSQRVDELESDVLFLGLFTRTLLDILVENDLCSLEKVAQRMRQLDLHDGKPDNALPVREVADELGVDMPERDRQGEFKERLREE